MKINAASQFYIILPLFFFNSLLAVSQNRDINYYVNRAQQNSPLISQNESLLRINLLQNQLIIAQNLKPHVYITGDLTLAPYFSNNGRFISLTPNPDGSAFGYDPALSNGGSYEALLNVDLPLITGGVSRALIIQNNIQNQILILSTKQTLHDIEKQVREQYINTFSVQQQINYLLRIIKLIDDRKKIADALVQKGLMQQTDYLLLDIEQNTRIIEDHQQEQSLTNAFTQLNNLCGIEDTTQYELEEPDFQQTPPVKTYNFAERFRFDSLSIVSQLNVLNTNNYPQLTLSGNLGLRTSDPTNISHNFGTGIGLHLNIPLYNGNQKNILLQQNRITFDTLSISHVAQLLNVRNTIKGLAKQIKTIRETISLYESQITKQELLLKILQDKLISGQVSTIDYVKSIEDYILTNQNLFNARVTLWQLINQYNYFNW